LISLLFNSDYGADTFFQTSVEFKTHKTALLAVNAVRS
jgi:hypothetical protein